MRSEGVRRKPVPAQYFVSKCRGSSLLSGPAFPTMKKLCRLLALLVLAAVSSAQEPPRDASAPKPPDDSPSPVYTLTDEEKAAGWKLLFDGRNNYGLRGLTYNDFINRGWKIDHGTLFCEKGFKSMGLVTGGHLITAEQYENFEFSFEWKLSVSGKSGIMYFAGGTRDKPIGFVYSIIDDTHHPDGLKGGPIKRSGALYGLLPPRDGKKLEEPGQWNKGRIVVEGNRVEHWLNGEKVLEFTLGTPELQKAILASGIKGGPMFGRKFKTALVILDEGEEVEFRNLRVRPLFSAALPATPTPRQ
jgi:hypothetical protein